MSAADEVLEAMARAIWTTYTNSQVPPEDLRGITWEQLTRWAQERPKLQEIVDLCFAEARAAIRAFPAGWVVAKVPAMVTPADAPREAILPTNVDYRRGWATGYNAALAVVRASAVEVE